MIDQNYCYFELEMKKYSDGLVLVITHIKYSIHLSFF